MAHSSCSVKCYFWSDWSSLLSRRFMVPAMWMKVDMTVAIEAGNGTGNRELSVCSTPHTLLLHLSLCSDWGVNSGLLLGQLGSSHAFPHVSAFPLALPFLLPQAATWTPLPSSLFPPCVGTYSIILDLSPSLLLVCAPCCCPRKAPPALQVLFC